MQARWRVLAAGALGYLIGFAWLLQRFDTSLRAALGFELVCMVAICVLGARHAARATRSRGPAKLALVLALIPAYNFASSISVLFEVTRAIAPLSLMLVGLVATLGGAGYILLVPAPPLPDALPTARTT